MTSIGVLLGGGLVLIAVLVASRSSTDAHIRASVEETKRLQIVTEAMRSQRPGGPARPASHLPPPRRARVAIENDPTRDPTVRVPSRRLPHARRNH